MVLGGATGQDNVESLHYLRPEGSGHIKELGNCSSYLNRWVGYLMFLSVLFAFNISVTFFSLYIPELSLFDQEHKFSFTLPFLKSSSLRTCSVFGVFNIFVAPSLLIIWFGIHCYIEGHNSCCYLCFQRYFFLFLNVLFSFGKYLSLFQWTLG